jgi:DNA-binding transcriptional regulator YiaG
MPSSAQSSINERIKFIIDKLGMSVRGFSTELGVSDTNTRNYIDRGSKPNSDYLQKVLRRFDSINPTWLLLGDGEPFLIEDNKQNQSVHIDASKNKGNLLNSNKGSNSIQSGVADDCQKELAVAQKEIELLRDQLKMQERTIQILMKQNR